ncbi:hypothetical protein D0865_03413 [Hortaea werneckii]|uniref:REJ domain-containing protein n=1 Tax=Hortaea werneckii TaxID=91943 RepID=A0A3M7CYM5_HORWE|nr:hypothetical protein D0865_03413 [Hortaea werneckii]
MEGYQLSDHVRRRLGPGHEATMDPASRSASFERRTRSDDSWVEISSQPSSSSLSSVNDDPATTGARVQHDARQRRRRTLRPGAPSHLNIASRAPSTSSQDEYEESESDDDRIMSSSGEGVAMPSQQQRIGRRSLGGNSSASEDNGQEQMSGDDDENRTAVNHPLRANSEACFTPQPNAFSHPPSSGSMRHASQPVVGSYFPSSRPPARHTGRQSLEARTPGHLPQNILSPSYNPSAAAQHDEALRASLSTLLSCAAAARGLPKSAEQQKRPQTAAPAQTSGQRPGGHRAEPMSFRLIPESAAPVNHPIPSPQQFQEPTFHPTLRRTSTSTSSSSSPHQPQAPKEKRKANVRTRSTSRERRLKKARRGSTHDELAVTPTLLTWVVSAGVVLFFSAVSFSAGYSLGKEAGRFEAGGVGGFAADDPGLRGCAKEAGRSSLGLKRSLARSAVQV